MLVEVERPACRRRGFIARTHQCQAPPDFRAARDGGREARRRASRMIGSSPSPLVAIAFAARCFEQTAGEHIDGECLRSPPTAWASQE